MHIITTPLTHSKISFPIIFHKQLTLHHSRCKTNLSILNYVPKRRKILHALRVYIKPHTDCQSVIGSERCHPRAFHFTLPTRLASICTPFFSSFVLLHPVRLPCICQHLLPQNTLHWKLSIKNSKSSKKKRNPNTNHR